MPAFFQDAFQRLLEEQPRLPFQALTSGFQPPMRRFFESQFDDIMNEFRGQQGKQIQRGEDPTLQFTDFLGGLDFPGRYQATPPLMAGRGTGRFVPRTFFDLGQKPF